MESKPLMTVREFADGFGVDPRTVRSWIKAGWINPESIICTPTGGIRIMYTEYRLLKYGIERTELER